MSTNSVATKPAATNAVQAATTAQSSSTVTAKSNTPPRPGALGSLGPRSKPAEKTVLPKRREDWLDITWSLINSAEFLYRH